MAPSVVDGGLRLGVDVGGTFTDFVMMDADGRTWFGKRLTTPDDPARAIGEGIAALLVDAAMSPEAVRAVVHATTLVTNAIVARRGARAALVTTRGFRDVLETGREMRYDVYDLAQRRPRPLVPRALRFEVSERVDGRGHVLDPLDEGELANVAAALRDAQVEAVAVGFLHSDRHPAHERRAGAVLQRLLPDVPVTLSSDVAAERGEYERFTTATANAYTRPLVAPYLMNLARRLASEGLRNATTQVMISNGGLAGLQATAEQPVRLVESGPAAGAVAAASIARSCGLRRLLSFDVGGTTAKLCLLNDGAPAVANGFEAARLNRVRRGSGLPLRIPSVDLIEIGAGGGSIATVDRLGLVQVGPESAGADPGPACYARGGTRPTLTDAFLLLGYLDPERFLGGAMRLDRAAAERAIGAVAGPFDGDPVRAAAAMVRVAAEAMAAAARVHLAERGQDARATPMLAFGGAGPLVADAMGRHLRVAEILVPPGAGVLSAAGLLAAAPMATLARSIDTPLERAAWSTIADHCRAMEAEAVALVREAGAPAEKITLVRSLDLRRAGGGAEFEVIMAGEPGSALVAALRDAYAEQFAAALGASARDERLEIGAVRVRASAPAPAFAWRGAASTTSPRPAGRRRAWFAGTGWLDCPVLAREGLEPDRVMAGPVMIEEAETTTVVLPGSVVVRRHDGFLALTPARAAAELPQRETAMPRTERSSR
jgi:N-methylhydantoinase A